MSAPHLLRLRAEAARCQALADACARRAAALAGRAAARRCAGDLAEARRLEARLAREERHEACALYLAAAGRDLAARLEARARTARALAAIVAERP
jgi:hypothetical protein